MRIGYLECFSGISGDMLLGALVDAGVPFTQLEQTAAALNVGARLEMRKVTRGGITGTKVDVITADHPLMSRITPIPTPNPSIRTKLIPTEIMRMNRTRPFIRNTRTPPIAISPPFSPSSAPPRSLRE